MALAFFHRGAAWLFGLVDQLTLIHCMAMLLALLVFFVYRCMSDKGHCPWMATVHAAFYQPIEQETGIGALSPLFATVYVRGAGSLHSQSVDEEVNHYAERLIVVSPQNWLIYTPDGIHFHFISNNISLSRSRCDTARSLNAIEYRLLAAHELAETPATYDNPGKLRLSCVNYTYDQLMRIFGSTAEKTVYDLAGYFDKKKNSRAPDLTVEEILDLFIVNGIV